MRWGQDCNKGTIYLEPSRKEEMERVVRCGNGEVLHEVANEPNYQHIIDETCVSS